MDSQPFVLVTENLHGFIFHLLIFHEVYYVTLQIFLQFSELRIHYILRIIFTRE